MELRTLIRRALPPQTRVAVRNLKKRLAGPSLFEVELGSYTFVPDPSEVPRLTLITPTTRQASAFGGITTGIDIFFHLAVALQKHTDLDVRIVQTNPEDIEEDNVARQIASRVGFDPEHIQFEPRTYKGADLALRSKEICMPFNWFCAGNILDAVAEQHKAFGGAPRPIVYPVQEYEPMLSPMSSDHLIAREIYDADWPIYAIVNSSQLSTWLETLGHDFSRKYVFEPRLSHALRPFLEQSRQSERKRQILIYGRPAEDRNCFPIIREGLKRWAERSPEQSSWEVVSAGTAHPPIDLGGGRKVTSLGKLTLQEYAATLCETAIGVSLMASPHPSYPPLEMAHFGLLTLTNRFAHKDLSTSHENIVSLPRSDPETFATELTNMCQAFEKDPAKGRAGQSKMPGYLSEDAAYPFMDALVCDLLPSIT